MDEQLTQPNIPPTIDIMPPQRPGNVQTSYHHKRRWVIIVVIVLVLLALAAVAYHFLHKTKTVVRTPVETLDDLRVTSTPDKQTVEQKSATIHTLQKNSKKPTVTPQQQMDMLNTLSK